MFIKRIFIFLLLFCVMTTHSLFPQDKKAPFTIVIHGGAGTILKKYMTPESEKEYREFIESVLRNGYKLLEEGKPGLDVVESCIHMLEDSPLFNAGKGAVFTHEGTNSMDASIMDGKTLKAGAVAGVSVVKNPISAARVVMDKSVHVMLSGAGADEFAKDQGLEIVDPSYFRVEKRWDQLQDALEKEKTILDHDGDHGMLEDNIPYQDYKYGTVGVVVLDKDGNLAAGTSTGGMTNKRWGRIGDSPVIGAGTYANNSTCAISCTGHGEYFIRYAVAHDISALMEYKGLGIDDAAKEVVMKKLVEAGGVGGVIGVDANGNVTMTFNSEGMYRGYMREGEDPYVGIYKDE